MGALKRAGCPPESILCLCPFFFISVFFLIFLPDIPNPRALTLEQTYLSNLSMLDLDGCCPNMGPQHKLNLMKDSSEHHTFSPFRGQLKQFNKKYWNAKLIDIQII